MLKLSHITKTYDEVVLNALDFELHQGDFVYLIGESGAGKSTLLSIMAGNTADYEGTVVFKEMPQDFAEEATRQSYKKKVQLVNQASMLDENLTIFENCAYGLEYRQVEKYSEKIDHQLSALKIAEQKDQFPTEVSGGELARANLAQVLLLEPEVLLLDELTSNLDPRNAEKILEILEALNASGLTILLSTHNHSLLTKFPHRARELKGGQLHDL